LQCNNLYSGTKVNTLLFFTKLNLKTTEIARYFISQIKQDKMKKCLRSHAYFDVTNDKDKLETQSFKDHLVYLHSVILTEKK
jgi:hypothetical protein